VDLGALFAIVVAVFAIWVGLRYANDERSSEVKFLVCLKQVPTRPCA